MSSLTDSVRESCLRYVVQVLLDRDLSIYTKMVRIREVIPLLEAAESLAASEKEQHGGPRKD